MSLPLLELRGLRCRFDTPGGPLLAVDGVDMEIASGEVLGLVGESGSGKSTLGKIICGLCHYQEGTVQFSGRLLPRRFRAADFRRQAQKVQMVFQDAYSAMNPRMTVLDCLREPLGLQGFDRRETARRAREWLERVGLTLAQAQRYPHELSGGQRQRVGIARAFINEPQLVICDEPVSALDVSVQAQIINLLRELQRDLGTAMLFIAHDLAVVRSLASRTLVMYHGTIVEEGPSEALFAHPRHPYTRTLLDANPIADPRRERARSRPVSMAGMVVQEKGNVSACRYAPRCPRADDRCRMQRPPLETHGDALGRFACYYPEPDR